MKKVCPGSILRVDKREDGIVRSSNITKFLAACSSTLGISSEDLFFRDDIIEGSSESLARVSRTIITLIKTSENSPLDPPSLQSRRPYDQLRSRGDVSPIRMSAPRSPLRPRFSPDRNHRSPPIPPVTGSSSLVDLSDTSSIISDTTTFSSLLDPGRSLVRSRHKRGSPATIMTATTARTSYSSLYQAEATPSIPSFDYEYHRGIKRSSGDFRTPGSLDSGLGETADVDLNQVAEEAGDWGSGVARTARLRMRKNLSSEDSPSGSPHTMGLGKGKFPDDFLPPTSPSKPTLPPPTTAASKLVLPNHNALENTPVRLTLTVREEGKPVMHFVSIFISPPVPFSCGISHSVCLSYIWSWLCFT